MARRPESSNGKSAGHPQRFQKIHGHRTLTADGRLESPTYTSWRAMMQRCYSKKHPSYEHYGGAGVIVTDRWHTFANFLEDMGARPQGTTLGRITPFSHYEPGECAWQTSHQQSLSIRRITFKHHKVTVDGRTKTKTGWAKWIGISYKQLLKRISQGWGDDAYRIRRGGKRGSAPPPKKGKKKR